MNKRPPRTGEAVKYTHTLLVDGNALFKRGFMGAKDEYNFRGEHIGGLYQFLTVFRKLLNEDVYHKAYVFWDDKFSGKMRYNIYTDYKSGRGKDYINGTQPVDESEVLQKAMIHNYLEELCVRQLKHEFVEADDFIAYYCLTAAKNEKITICTNDRDLSQLISDKVRIYFCDLKQYVDKANYNSYFCHHQSNIVLLKTIMGDDSDTITGVKGVKEKTLLKHFPELKTRKVTLDEIIKKAIELQENRISTKQKPLLALDYIAKGVTEGIQGDRLYEINQMLVDLSVPLITEDAIEALNELKRKQMDASNRGIKNVLLLMRKDGLDKTIGTEYYAEYLLPFKKLMDRENKQSDKNPTL